MRILGLVIGLLLVSSVTYAENAVLAWNANSEVDLAGYKIYRANQNCTAAGPLAPLAQVGKVLTYTDANLPAMDGTMCWEISAFDTAGNESGRSNRVSKVLNTNPPVAPVGLSVVIQ